MAAAAVLRDVAIDPKAHVLARPRTVARTPDARPGARPGATQVAAQADPATAARNHDEQRAYEQGVAEGRALAMKQAQADLEQLVADRVSAGVQVALANERERAREEGLSDALQQAKVILETERGVACARLEDMLRELAGQAREWMAAAEEEVVLLAHDVACRVIAPSAVQPSSIRVMVQRLLAERPHAWGGLPQVDLHVNPEDFALVSAAASPEGWRWVSDPAVSLGGVILRSGRANFDARLETQLGTLADLLKEARRQRGGGMV